MFDIFTNHCGDAVIYYFSFCKMLLCRLLMGKGGVSTADSYYLHIKHIGENSINNLQRGMLEGLIKSSQMFSENAMCQ